MTSPLLYTFAISHFSEKARWACDYKKLNYREVQWIPGVHVPLALRIANQSSVPIWQEGKASIQGSSEIILALEEKFPDVRLLPTDPKQAQQVREIDARITKAAKKVPQWFYHTLLQYPEVLSRLFTWTVPQRQKAMKFGFPVLKFLMQQTMKINSANAQTARAKLGAELDWLEAQLADGRRFLVGNQFSLADLSVSALLAPLAAPPEHPLYSWEENIKLAAPLMGDWVKRPLMEWIRQNYREFRGGPIVFKL